MEDDDGFEVIDSQYQLIQSVRIPEPRHKINHYSVMITPSKNVTDLNIMENQYYQMGVKKDGQHYCTAERRFSEFELIFEYLSSKRGGFIFPAFPENGIFAFMKTKVSMTKDQSFIERRIKIIIRFFNMVLNTPEFDPERCPEMKEFLFEGKAYKTFRQIENNSQGYFNVSWNKIKTYFAPSKENKYSEIQARLNALKQSLQVLYTKCRMLIDLLRQEQLENNKFLNQTLSLQKLKEYIQIIQAHDKKQLTNINNLQNLQFILFCQNEDLQMVNRIFDRISKLKDDETNYPLLKEIQDGLQIRLQNFISMKIQIRNQNLQNLKEMIDEIKKVGRIAK